MSKEEVIAAYGELSKALAATHQAVTRFQIALSGADEDKAKELMADLPHLPYWPKDEVKDKKDKKKKKDRDPNAPKRPPSAYLEYQNSVRQDIRAADPTLDYAEVLRKIAAAWAAMPAEEKSVWTELTQRKTAEFELRKAEYVATHGQDPDADDKAVTNGEDKPKKRGRKSNAEKAAAATPSTLEKIAQAVDQAPKDKKKSKAAPATPATKTANVDSSEVSSDSDDSDASDSDSSDDEAAPPPPPSKKDKKVSTKKDKVEEPKKKKSKH